MKPAQSPVPLWLRAAYFILGTGLLFWLPIEDTGLTSPLLFAGGAGVLVGVHAWLRFAATPCLAIWTRYPASGMILGGAIPLLAGFLMVFKNGLHAHGFPDFSPDDLGRLLRWTPWGAAAGLAGGLAASLWRQKGCP